MPEQRVLQSDRLPRPLGPYSVATIWGELLFVSGQIPSDPSQDIEGQTAQVMEKLRIILEEAGTGFVHVLKMTCFLADFSDFERFNIVYERYVGEPKPVRTTIECGLVAPEHKVAVDTIAHIPDRPIGSNDPSTPGEASSDWPPPTR